MYTPGMQAQCVRIPILPGKTQRFIDWLSSIASRREEMVAAMRAEGVVAETICIERGQHGDAVIFYMRAHDIAHAQRTAATSALPIDRETRSIIAECWDVAAARHLDVALELVGPAW